jgi:urease accessory protein
MPKNVPDPLGWPSRFSSLSPGQGILELSLVAGRTAVVRAAATSPLKLLMPRRPGAAAWIYTSTYGGGLVAGDEFDLRLRLGSQTTCIIGTQSTTKVYKSPGGRVCRQTLAATVDDGALLVVAPDPVSCFTGARYEQRQRIEMHRGGALVVVDWFTSGRRCRGESWQMDGYASRLDIEFDGQHVLADAWRLSPDDGPLDSPFRLGRFHCAAALVLVGSQLAEAGSRLLASSAGLPIAPDGSLLEAGSPIPHGVVLRLLGETPEQVGRRLTDRLSFLASRLGEAPWSRKW